MRTDTLIVILGPTATGKSALAISLAEGLGRSSEAPSAEILCCDSTQIYRHFDVGTAKTPFDERRGIPHHLLDLAEPREVFTAGDYRRCALEVLADLRRRGGTPILAAGTGLYLRALLEGLADAPVRSEELRARLRRSSAAHGAAYLHRLLVRLDPQAAARIAARDTQKIIRALEIRLLTGKPRAAVHASGRPRLEGYEIVKIGLLPPRAALYARINARVHQMLAAGWLGEVRRLAAAFPRNAKPFQFIGYSQLLDVLNGRASVESAIPRIQQATRNFAKRQITWFRREPGVHWLPVFGDDPAALDSALVRLSSDLRFRLPH